MGNAEKIKVKEEEILPKVEKEEKLEQQAEPAPEVGPLLYEPPTIEEKAEKKEVEQQAEPAPEVVKAEKKEVEQQAEPAPEPTLKEEKKEVEQQAPPAPDEEKEVEQQAPPAPEVVKEEKKVKKIDKLPKDEYKASELQNNDKCVAGKDTPKDTGKNVPIETRCPGDYVSIMKCPKILGQKTNFINLTHKNVDGKALFKYKGALMNNVVGDGCIVSPGGTKISPSRYFCCMV